MADTHFSVQKGERDGRTYTRLERLDRSQRREELARLTDRTVHLVDGRIVSPQPDGPQPADGPEAAV